VRKRRGGKAQINVDSRGHKATEGRHFQSCAKQAVECKKPTQKALTPTAEGGIRTHTRGEPDGILSPAPKDSNLLHTKALTENDQSDLASYLAQIAQKDPDLAELVKVWPELPEHIRRAIRTLTEPFGKAQKSENP
jgi:hypothetical protein